MKKQNTMMLITGLASAILTTVSSGGITKPKLLKNPESSVVHKGVVSYVTGIYFRLNTL